MSPWHRRCHAFANGLACLNYHFISVVRHFSQKDNEEEEIILSKKYIYVFVTVILILLHQELFCLLRLILLKRFAKR